MRQKFVPIWKNYIKNLVIKIPMSKKVTILKHIKQQMKTNILLIVKLFFIIISLQTNVFAQNSKELFINANSGNDQNNGTKDNPLKSLSAASKRVNEAEGKGAITIYLAGGIYGMAETAKFNPAKWQLSKENRLTIRAEKLPDDADWNPGDMPVMVSTMPFDIQETNEKKEITGAFNYGILIETSHVTIQGLRILGEPVHESPKSGILIRNYPIVWDGKDLEDFRVTQCLFLGNKIALPNHLGILASGKALEVDHCVFYGIKDAVVMWNTPAEGCKMHHNLFLNTYGAMVWTWSTTDDFKFYNNVMSNVNVIWVTEKKEAYSFTIDNSIFMGYKELINKGGGPAGFGEKANSAKLKLGKNVTLKKEGKLEIEEDPTSRNYLHIVPGTLGDDLGAGLFTK